MRGGEVEQDVDIHLFGLERERLLAGGVDDELERLGPAWRRGYSCRLCYAYTHAQQQARFYRQLV